MDKEMLWMAVCPVCGRMQVYGVRCGDCICPICGFSLRFSDEIRAELDD